MTAVLVKRGMGVDIHMGSTSCKDEGSVEVGAIETKEHQGFAANYQKLRER